MIGGIVIVALASEHCELVYSRCNLDTLLIPGSNIAVVLQPLMLKPFLFFEILEG